VSNAEYNLPCPDCAALNVARATQCWLCYRSFVDEPPLSSPRHVTRPTSGFAPDRDTLTIFDIIGGIAAGLVAISLGIGVAAQSQALGVLLFIVMIPLALAALAHVFREHRRGIRLGYLEIFLGAMGGAFVLALLGLSILIALFIACLCLIVPSGPYH
jgi:hypothetical protein